MAILSQVCVYCGSSVGEDPAYAESARILGRAMAQARIRLVYGGGSVGLMGIIARTVLDEGGAVTGIIPRFLEKRERVFPDVSELIVTKDMHERKMTMFERADAFVALPGGIGTLEELIEQLTWAQLGQHQKPVLLANISGFWQPLIDLLDHMRAEQFIHSGVAVCPLVAENVDDIVPMLVEACAARPQEAIELPADAEEIRRL